MLRKIVLLVICSFLTLTAYAEEKTISNDFDPLTDVDVSGVTVVKEGMIDQYFFTDASQKMQVFVNDSNKILNFGLIVIRDSSEGPVMVMCKMDDNRPAEVEKVWLGESYSCKTKKWVAFYYKSRKGFATGKFNIALSDNKAWI